MLANPCLVRCAVAAVAPAPRVAPPVAEQNEICKVRILTGETVKGGTGWRINSMHITVYHKY